MKNSTSRYARRSGTVACAVLSLGVALPLAAQDHAHHPDMAMPEAGVRAEMIQDLDFLAQRYLSLSDAMTEHYAWRPGEGVRSMSEVLMHVAAANYMIPTMAGVAPPEGMDRETMMSLEQVTDPARVREELEHSFQHAKHAIARTPDSALDDAANLFGRDTTKRAVLMLLVGHAHEHLGQSIAYARTNAVVPPWSEGR